MWVLTLTVLVLAYLLGSFPTAYIAGRIVCGKDIRQMGDGNMGAQNAFRQLGARTGVTVGIIDFLKGIAVIVLARVSDMSTSIVLLSGVLAVMGHNWPFFLHFRGGRGEATTIGILLMLVTWPMLIAGFFSLLTLLKTKNVTIASIPLFVLLPILGWVFHVRGTYIIYGMALPGIVALTHAARVRGKILRPA